MSISFIRIRLIGKGIESLSGSVWVFSKADVVAVDYVHTLDELEIALITVGIAHFYWDLLLIFGGEGSRDEWWFFLSKDGRGVHYVFDLADLQLYVGRLLLVVFRRP